MAVRFLHIADLHLGSAFGGMSRAEARAWRTEGLEALRTVLAEATDKGASLLLFAGDVFDTPTPDTTLAESFFAILHETGLPTVIAPGNHDYFLRGGIYDSGKIPENVFIFREEALTARRFPTLGVTVYGYAFRQDTHEAPTLPAKEELRGDTVNILLAHGVLGTPASPYAPITGAALSRAGFDYAALGHVHLPQAPCRFGNTVAAYPGFFAGRGFDETGAGHANLVTVDGARIEILPLTSTAYQFHILDIDCTGAANGEDVRRLVAAALGTASLPKKSAVRAMLSGEVGADCLISAHALTRLGAEFSLFEIKDNTAPLFDRARLLCEPSLRGAFYRAMQKHLENDDADARAIATEALRLGLAALAGKEVL